MIVSMKSARRLLCLALACSTVAACGGSGGGGGTSDRQQIVNMFNGMFAAIQQGNWGRTCSYLSERQQSTVVAGARRGGVTASSCADALNKVIKEAGITRAQLAQAFGAGATKRKLDSISVHGNQATVTFTETGGGQTYTETDAVVRQGGTWRADRILKRSQTA